MLGLDLGEVSPSYAYYFNAIKIEDQAYTQKAVEKALAGEGEYDVEYCIIRKDGAERMVHAQAKVERDTDGNLLRMIGTAHDITERKHREEGKILLQRELSQSHKMEALGKLTGEVAHEYNNMLAIMLGFSQLLQESFIDNPKVFKYEGEIRHAGNRAAKLTNKLLTFSQGKIQVAKNINLNSLLQQQHHMLEKTLTVSINLVYELQENPWQVWIDGSDMEDAILNMCINAMYAMNGCGRLTIETHNKSINSSDAASLSIITGDYVLFSITDTGCGISKKNKAKIFDPFFTTKGHSGSGLGLSIVYGFVHKSGGAITVDSVEGEGTKFSLYFPRYNGTRSKNKVEIDIPLENTFLKNQTILIVDDEPALVKLTQEILTAQGFTIFSAGDANQALSILDHESIDLMLCDVILPGVNGFQLAVIVKDQYPDIKIQLISGFTGNRNNNMATEALQKNMLKKPFNSKDLLKKIHTLLDEKK
jgi:signal transduction histidine kinase